MMKIARRLMRMMLMMMMLSVRMSMVTVGHGRIDAHHTKRWPRCIAIECNQRRVGNVGGGGGGGARRFLRNRRWLRTGSASISTAHQPGAVRC
uniref:Putative secreted protein n=1 Tax=Anopheles triannulatus TaxID=58253 RepID=A0A2M4B7E1_9DIPT